MEELDRLIVIMQDNPDLEVVPMVDGSLAKADKYQCWQGKRGKPHIEYIYKGLEKVYVRSIDDIRDVLGEQITNLDIYSDEDFQRLCDLVPWKKVILVWINPL